MDFKGQELAENIYYYLNIVFGVTTPASSFNCCCHLIFWSPCRSSAGSSATFTRTLGSCLWLLASLRLSASLYVLHPADAALPFTLQNNHHHSQLLCPIPALPRTDRTVREECISVLYPHRRVQSVVHFGSRRGNPQILTLERPQSTDLPAPIDAPLNLVPAGDDSRLAVLQ